MNKVERTFGDEYEEMYLFYEDRYRINSYWQEDADQKHKPIEQASKF
jgi:hypothetical protein